MATPATDETDATIRGSGNVFADLGYPNAEGGRPSCGWCMP
jgi:hypothetical protein